jgi:putative flippase GtrA
MSERTGQVRSIHALYERFRQLVHEAAKFGIVGGTATLLTLGGADALHLGLGVDGFTSLAVATLVATVFSYLANRFWTFRHRESAAGTPRETTIFFVLNAIGLLIQECFIWAARYGLGLKGGLWYNAALIVGIGFGTLFRFWSYRKWVWVAPQDSGAQAAVASGARPARGGKHRAPAGAGRRAQAASQPAPLDS